MQLSVNEDGGNPEQIAIDGEFGPAQVRALVEAVLGKREGMKGPYKKLTTLRLWRCYIREEGVNWLAKLLLARNASALTCLQLLDNNISPQGITCLGKALSAGGNTSLLSLTLDCNQAFGSCGAEHLFKGLRTNSCLKKLSLAYCKIGEEAAHGLQQLLAFPSSSIHTLNLKGNRLKGAGMVALATALKKNSILKELDFSDNSTGPNLSALGELCEMLKVNKGLTSLRIDQNGIEDKGAEVLLSSGVFEKTSSEYNNTLKLFTVDISLSQDVFTKLSRTGGGASKKGSKKKKKKK